MLSDFESTGGKQTPAPAATVQQPQAVRQTPTPTPAQELPGQNQAQVQPAQAKSKVDEVLEQIKGKAIMEKFDIIKKLFDGLILFQRADSTFEAVGNVHTKIVMDSCKSISEIGMDMEMSYFNAVIPEGLFEPALSCIFKSYPELKVAIVKPDSITQRRAGTQPQTDTQATKPANPTVSMPNTNITQQSKQQAAKTASNYEVDAPKVTYPQDRTIFYVCPKAAGGVWSKVRRSQDKLFVLDGQRPTGVPSYYLFNDLGVKLRWTEDPKIAGYDNKSNGEESVNDSLKKLFGGE